MVLEWPSRMATGKSKLWAARRMRHDIQSYEIYVTLIPLETQWSYPKTGLFNFSSRYHYQNAEHVRLPLDTAKINVYFQDNGPLGCFADCQVLNF